MRLFYIFIEDFSTFFDDSKALTEKVSKVKCLDSAPSSKYDTN